MTTGMTTGMHIPTAPSAHISITGRDINLFDSSSKFADEGQKTLWFDRRIEVPLGKLFVFPQGIVNNIGINEIYSEGEVVYVGGRPNDDNRQIVKLNKRGASYTIFGKRPLNGITMSPAEIATLSISITFEIVSPLHLLRRYAGRVDQINNLIEQKIDEALQPSLTDNMWRVPAQILANTLVTDVNRSLQSEGLRVDPLTASVHREFPERVKTIVEECRLAEHVLIDMMDGGRYEQLFDPAHNAQRIIELQKDPNHAFLDEGDLTVFVNGVTQPHSPRGRTFLDILIHKVKAAHPDVPMIKHFTATYAGPTTYAFIEAYLNDISTNSNVPEWNLSVDVVRNNF